MTAAKPAAEAGESVAEAGKEEKAPEDILCNPAAFYREKNIDAAGKGIG